MDELFAPPPDPKGAIAQRMEHTEGALRRYPCEAQPLPDSHSAGCRAAVQKVNPRRSSFAGSANRGLSRFRAEFCRENEREGGGLTNLYAHVGCVGELRVCLLGTPSDRKISEQNLACSCVAKHTVSRPSVHTAVGGWATRSKVHRGSSDVISMVSRWSKISSCLSE